MPSQNQVILQHLKQKGKITARMAALHYNVWRLSARILELRDRGFHIVTDMQETDTSPVGDYAIYRLIEVNETE